MLFIASVYNSKKTLPEISNIEFIYKTDDIDNTPGSRTIVVHNIRNDD